MHTIKPYLALSPPLEFLDSLEFQSTLAIATQDVWYLTSSNVVGGWREILKSPFADSFPCHHFVVPYVVWSKDGRALFGTATSGQFVRIRFSDLEVRDKQVILPPEWAERPLKPVVRAARWDPHEDILYCLATDIGWCSMEVWALSSECRAARLLATDWRWSEATVALNPESEGPFLVCTGALSGVETILLQTRDGQHITEFSMPGLSPRFLGISPSGRHCAFSSVGHSLRPSLHIVDLATGAKQNVAEANLASWSPDGRTIAAMRWNEELLLIDAQTLQVRTLLSVRSEAENRTERGLYGGAPMWSSDSNWLAVCVAARLHPDTNLEEWWSDGHAPAKVLARTLVLDLAGGRIAEMSVVPYSMAWRPRTAGASPRNAGQVQ